MVSKKTEKVVGLFLSLNKEERNQAQQIVDYWINEMEV